MFDFPPGCVGIYISWTLLLKESLLSSGHHTLFYVLEEIIVGLFTLIKI